MPNLINCPHCNASLQLPESAAGRTVKCPMCQKGFVASAQGEAPSPPVSVPGVPDEGKAKSKRNILFVVAVLLLVGLVVAPIGCFMRGGRTDVREVVADPHAYAGQHLRSEVRVISPSYFKSTWNDADGLLLIPLNEDIARKSLNTARAVSEYDWVLIEYRIWTEEEFADIQRFEKKREHLEEELDVELAGRLSNYESEKRNRLDHEEIVKREQEGSKAAEVWRTEEFQVSRDEINQTRIRKMFRSTLHHLKVERDAFSEEGTPEHDSLLADIDLCTEMQIEFETRFKEIEDETNNRREASSRNGIYSQYRAADAEAQGVRDTFYQEAELRRQELTEEENRYFNREHGHDAPDGSSGYLLDLKILD